MSNEDEIKLIKEGYLSAKQDFENKMEDIKNTNAMASYKGDIYSTRMDRGDVISDLDGNNIYNRMINSSESLFNIYNNYNESVINGDILYAFSQGDPGFKYTQKYVDDIYSDRKKREKIIEGVKKEFFDIVEEELKKGE